MYSKEEAQEIRRLFWTGFGQYMGKHRGQRGTKQKWTNYRTHVRDLYFRMEADTENAKLCIDIQHDDPGIRQLFFEQWEEFFNLLTNLTAHQWEWLPLHKMETGKEIARIQAVLPDCNMYNEKEWETIWTWFEGIWVGLDELWADAVDTFQDLSR